MAVEQRNLSPNGLVVVSCFDVPRCMQDLREAVGSKSDCLGGLLDVDLFDGCDGDGVEAAAGYR